MIIFSTLENEERVLLERLCEKVERIYEPSGLTAIGHIIV